ncbi:MAG: hypothetical protein HC780_18320 [Leptolyngbyaceae cyanobacterium CSU_1_3]|nr:hypothetical protein [Leptolyngbyaceae cyanobacterium CSU_1_3]
MFWAIAPPTAQAESHQVNLLLNAQPNETFETLMRQAAAIARESVKQRFVDPATTEVSSSCSQRVAKPVPYPSFLIKLINILGAIVP